MTNSSQPLIRKAVILAGGLGLRLRPLTNILPKPMLPIGESTILEIQILALKKHGVKEIFIAANYMADYLDSVVGDGEKYGVRVQLSLEKEPLGTCGPITLLRDRLDEPFFMMNGDILTDLNFTKLAAFAVDRQVALTVVTKEIAIPFRFGRVVAEGDYITAVEEKPSFLQEILAGIYVLTPAVFNYIPQGKYYGVDALIKDMLARKQRIGKYLTKDYWIDIGQLEDYEAAKRDVQSNIVRVP